MKRGKQGAKLRKSSTGTTHRSTIKNPTFVLSTFKEGRCSLESRLTTVMVAGLTDICCLIMGSAL